MLEVAAVLNGTGAHVDLYQARDDIYDGGSATLNISDLRREFTDVVIDSRAVVPGSLFIALPGQRADGHEYVGEAVARGARGVVVTHAVDYFPKIANHPEWQTAPETQGTGLFVFMVDECLTALQSLARYWRRQHGPQIIGVTGSIGKTTAKEIIASLLSKRGPVLRSEENFNTEIGLPLTLLRLRQQWAAVLEMGMYAMGDIAALCHIAEPTVGVVTNVAPVHLERMGTIERVAHAKSELIAALPPNGLAILNADDPWTRAMAQTSGVARNVLVGVDSQAAIRAEDVRVRGLQGVSFEIRAEGRSIPIHTRVPGAHMVYPYLAAAAAAREFGMGWTEIQARIGEIELDCRQKILTGPGNLVIIDDSYNAAPMSMHAALQILSASPGRKVAVLGDMLELGVGEQASHHEIGERAAEVADWLVVRGDRGNWIADAAERSGLPPGRVKRAASNQEAADVVRGITTGPERWSVLVKGSRGMQMDEVVHALRENE